MNTGTKIKSNIRSFRINDIILFNNDFLKAKIRPDLAELIITSPPYNIGIDYGKYDDNKTYSEYVEFSKNWLEKSFKILKDNGRLCINVPIDTGKSGKRSVAADLTVLAKKAGFKYKGTIIWNKQNVRNKHSMVFSKNLEVILVFYRGDWKSISSEYRDYVNEIWTFAGENGKRVAHPAPFPVEIPRRLIKMMSQKGDVVVDPFLGGGTTMVACSLFGRKGIGVEIDEKYFEVAKKRLMNKKI